MCTLFSLLPSISSLRALNIDGGRRRGMPACKEKQKMLWMTIDKNGEKEESIVLSLWLLRPVGFE